ncbi:MAG: penicillin acylase family protein [Acidobacteriota bacterium]|nr:penicillin acylase family protein [Acidobacteriota bacterium]
MRLKTAVKTINLSIAVLIAALLAVAYWFAWRPLPDVSGDLRAPVTGPATVVRDALGVPHIQAATWEDAIFLQGYVTAQDRLWQMDALRRLAGGELSEIVGASALEVDREARRLRMRRMAEQQYLTLPVADRQVLAAYARGINFFIETHRGRYPVEFTILRYDPRPWSVVDSILAGLQMYRNLTTTWVQEVKKAQMLAGGDKAKVDALWPSRTGREVQPGSNAWVLAGSRTATGKPILANDPHLEFSLPSTWYMVHLRAPGLNVTGVALPGVPGVIIGHNERIAWGVTNLGYDVQDLYRESLDPRNGRYRFRGQVEQARFERELIPVKGAKPVEFAQWVTRHGPVSPGDGNQYLALRWAAAESGSFQFPFFDIDRARNWDEFTAAIRRFPGPGQNIVYADVDGNIGYHATGMLPIRRNYDGDVPVDGSSGEWEWDGFIPFEQLPASFNPPSGAIVTANQNPFPLDYAYRVHGEFAPHYRSTQIRDLLFAKKGWKAEDMLVVQKDVYSGFMHFLARRIVTAWDAKKASNPDLKEAVDLLRSWNGQMEKGTAAPEIVSFAYQEVRKRVAESASPGKGQVYTDQMGPAVVEEILASGATGWFADTDAMLLKALTDAMEEAERTQGSSFKRWDYGKYNQLTIKQPVLDQIPWIGKWFNVGPVKMSGSSTTVKQTTTKVGPSMRFVADLADWERSLNNITIGESGQPLSSHYTDQWASYWSAKSFPMQFEKLDGKATLTFRPK